MIGGIGKAVSAIQNMDPKDVPKFPMEAKREQKRIQDGEKALAAITSSMKELGKHLAESNGLVGKLAKSAQAKPKQTNEKTEQLRRDATKAMEEWQAARIKLIESKIGEVEKELNTLRALLADAKKRKPASWFK